MIIVNHVLASQKTNAKIAKIQRTIYGIQDVSSHVLKNIIIALFALLKINLVFSPLK